MAAAGGRGKVREQVCGEAGKAFTSGTTWGHGYTTQEGGGGGGGGAERWRAKGSEGGKRVGRKRNSKRRRKH